MQLSIGFLWNLQQIRPFLLFEMANGRYVSLDVYSLDSPRLDCALAKYCEENCSKYIDRCRDVEDSLPLWNGVLD